MIKDEVLKSFAGKTVLVTGGTGLIGRQLVDLLCDAGATVRVVSLDSIKLNPKAEYVYGDLAYFDFCRKITQDIDYVFHLAGIKGSINVVESKLAILVPLLMMNTNMLEAARVNKVKKTVYTSTIGAYANTDIFRESDYRVDSIPMDFPAWAKRMAELQVHAYKVQYGLENFSVVRPSNIYGPGDNFDPGNAMVIPSLMHRIFSKENPVKIWGNGSAVRDFAYSRDIAEGTILALYHGTKSSFVNLGSGQEVSVRELVETLRSFIDFNYEFDATKSSGYPKRVMDISLARKLIDYNPSTSLREGLETTWKWFLANRDEYQKKKNFFLE